MEKQLLAIISLIFSSPSIEGFELIHDVLTPDIDGIIIVIDNTIGITETDTK